MLEPWQVNLLALLSLLSTLSTELKLMSEKHRLCEIHPNVGGEQTEFELLGIVT
jgi:hypothetical protein